VRLSFGLFVHAEQHGKPVTAPSLSSAAAGCIA